MHQFVTVNSWVAIREGCPMSCDIQGSGETHFLCGSPTDGFELSFEADALRAFLELGLKTLAEMDARYADENAAELVAGVCDAGLVPAVAEAVRSAT